MFKIKGISSASQKLKSAGVAKRQVNIEEEYAQTASINTVITLWALCEQGKLSIGTDALVKEENAWKPSMQLRNKTS